MFVLILSRAEQMVCKISGVKLRCSYVVYVYGI